MTEEAIVEEVIEETIESTEEEHALEDGWKPEEEFEGEEGKWIDAKTFNMRGELMDRIKSQTSQLKGQDKKLHRMEKAVKELADHNRKIEEQSYKKALKELKELKAEALSMSEYDQVVDIDEKMGELKELQKESEQEPESQQNTNSQEAEAWVADNTWYQKDRALRGAFDGIAQDLVEKDPSLESNMELLLEKASRLIKQEFPNKFGRRTQQRNTVSEPGSAQEGRQSKQKYGVRHLNSQQREFGQTFVESGAFKTLNEYTQQLAELGDLDIQQGA